MQNLLAQLLKTKSALVVFLILLSTTMFSQNKKIIDEKNLILSQEFKDASFKKRDVKFLKTKSKNVFIRYNPISLSFGAMMFFYQKQVSQQIAANCPYEISCSAFSKACIQKYGLIKGVALSADRLTRCTQFTVIDMSDLNLNRNNKIIDSVETYSHQYHKHKHENH
jgi:putative component of membrane protein insertase Oxa1/YidC/SpoIIIJ protein YidD